MYIFRKNQQFTNSKIKTFNEFGVILLLLLRKNKINSLVQEKEQDNTDLNKFKL